MTSGAQGGAPLGRLFFTPEQRSALEQQRRHPAAAGEAKGLSLDGQVLRSSGRNTLWVNGQAVDPRLAGPLLGPRPPRVGNGLDADGQAVDLLRGGRLSIQSRP